MKITAILMGSGGELDRVSFDPRTVGANPEAWTLDDLARAVAAGNGGHSWTLGDGDTIKITESAR